MTGRVCPVHGEYAADGICRWCEGPQTIAEAFPYPVKRITREEAIEMFGEPSDTEKAEVACEYDWTRGPEVDMLEALEAPLYAEVPPPGKLTEAMVGLLARLPPAPREWTLIPTEPVIEVATWRTPPANEGWEEIRIDAQHAALRWERVARRWATKHPLRFIYVTYTWIPGESP